MKRNVHPQRAATLPPLNVSRMDSPEANVYKQNESDTTNYFQRVAAAQHPTPTVTKKPIAHLIEAAQTILFTASSLQRTVSRCIGCIGNDSLTAAFSPTLFKSKSSTEKLVHCLDSVDKRATTESCNDLLHTTALCITILKELCWTLRTRLSTLVQGLDAKFSRNLLMNIYSTTVDMKDAWETIRPYLTVHPLTWTHHKSSATTPTVYKTELTAHSPITHPSLSCTPPSNGGGDNSQLYSHLRNAVAGSLHVLNTLGQSIEDTLQDGKTSLSLEKKLTELLRQAKYATELSNRLDKNVEANMGNNKEDLLLLPTKKESSRRIWEDTSLYLKAIVSVMTFIRSISTEEDFVWPKSIKQGCLYVTRMTAEVAKLWNNSSTFAEEGFYLGRQERSSSVSSEQCVSPGSEYTIPMQRRNTQQ